MLQFYVRAPSFWSQVRQIVLPPRPLNPRKPSPSLTISRTASLRFSLYSFALAETHIIINAKLANVCNTCGLFKTTTSIPHCKVLYTHQHTPSSSIFCSQFWLLKIFGQVPGILCLFNCWHILLSFRDISDHSRTQKDINRNKI